MNKLVTITPEGEFIAPPPKLSKFKYIGMMNIRVGMVGGAGRSAGQAATIAIRYSCVRRQVSGIQKRNGLSLSLSLSLSLFGLVSALPLWFCPEPVLAVHHRVSDAPSPKRPLRFSFLSACFSRFLHSLRMQGFKDSKVKKRSF